MRSGLAGVLSEPAARLYEQLVVVGELPLDGEAARSAAAAELIDRGFAREEHVTTKALLPVEPARAIDNAILVRQRQILDQYQMLLRLRDQMSALQQSFHASAAVRPEQLPDLVRVLTDGEEIGALSLEMVLSAQEDVVSLETEHFTKPPDPKSARTLPADLVARGVRFRNVYSRAVLEDVPGSGEMLRASIESGWDCRVYPKLPMKLIVVDHSAALVPLGPTGMEGALMVRAPVVVAALRDYFELLWNRSVPAPGNRGKLGAEQDEVLRLVLTGMTDGAIARHLDVSERTVRRHVGALQERLGVTNRVTLAVAAVRDGWLD